MSGHIKIPSPHGTLSGILAKGTQLSHATGKVVGAIGRRHRSWVESYAPEDALPIEEMKAQFGALQHIFASPVGQFSSPQEYIDKMWVELTRSHRSWFLGALEDSKVQNGNKSPFYIYVSDKEDAGRVRQEVQEEYAQVLGRIQRYRVNPKSQSNPNGEEPIIKIAEVVRIEDGQEVTAKQLVPATEDNILKPEDIRVVKLRRDHKTGELVPPPKDKHGLLYVPEPYIVPGVKFNEMYNWDSAFVIRGLLHSGEFEKAKFLVDDMLYQVENYGTILNGNRTNYMDRPDPQNPDHIQKHRSQPPLLTAKLLGIYKNYEALENMVPQDGVDKVAWLKKVLPVAEDYHQFWMTAPHLAPALGGNETSLTMYNSMRQTRGDEVKYSEPRHYANALKDLTLMYNTVAQVVGNIVLEGNLDEKQEEIVRRNKFDRQKNIDELGANTIRDIFAAKDAGSLTSKQKEVIEGLNEQQRKDLYYIEQYLDFNTQGKPAKLSKKFMRGD